MVVCHDIGRTGIYHGITVLCILKYYAELYNMKRFVIKLSLVLFLLCTGAGVGFEKVQAQCAMCSLTADASVKNGNKQGETLNKGIYVLLSAPYLAVGVVGFIWYKRFRKNKPAEPFT